MVVTEQFLSAAQFLSHFFSAEVWASHMGCHPSGKKSAPACTLHGPQFLQEMSICSSVRSSTGCRIGHVSLDAWSTSFSNFGVPSAVSHAFCSLLVSVQPFLTFPRFSFPEASHLWLSSALQWVWSWLCPWPLPTEVTLQALHPLP